MDLAFRLQNMNQDPLGCRCFYCIVYILDACENNNDCGNHSQCMWDNGYKCICDDGYTQSTFVDCVPKQGKP